MASNNDKLNLLVLLGTRRDGRRSGKVAKLVLNEAKKHPRFKVNYLDARDIDIQVSDETDEKYAEAVADCDAMLIITPEYNHSFPGELKMILDSEFNIYNHRAASIVAVSKGRFGGTRVIEHLIPVLANFGLYISRFNVNVTNVIDNVDKQGNTKERALIDQITGALDELAWRAAALRKARQD